VSSNRKEDGTAMRLISYPQLKPEKGIPFSKQYIGQLEREGRFPRRINPAGGVFVTWLESEIDDWIRQQAAEHRGPARMRGAEREVA
jgi:predicted DNA-binding transcriptional regulator AlpA